MGIVIKAQSGTADQDVRWIEIDRPSVANALDTATLRALCEAIEAAGQDPAVAAIVIGAAGGRHFCAGADGSEPRSPQRTVDFREGLGRLLRSVVQANKPVVAAIEGAASGAGAILAITVDCAVMAQEAFLSFPELNVGVPPLLPFDLLSHCAGSGIAKDLALSGRRIDAAASLRHGLVAHVAAKSDVRALAEREAAALKSKSADAFACYKRHLAAQLVPMINRAVAEMAS